LGGASPFTLLAGFLGGIMKIALLVPWDSPFIWTKPMFNIANMEVPEGFEKKIIYGDGWCPAARHISCVNKAMTWGADYMQFLGADQLHPMDMIPRLYSHIQDGWDMATAMVPARGSCGPKETPPFQSMAFRFDIPMPKTTEVDYVPVAGPPEGSYTLITENDPSQQVHVVGTGTLLFKREHIENLEPPWFQEFISKPLLYERTAIQDSHFTYRLTIDHGLRLWCDTTIEVLHLEIFGIDRTFSERFKDVSGTDTVRSRL
jgi:hypothetical protein